MRKRERLFRLQRGCPTSGRPESSLACQLNRTLVYTSQILVTVFKGLSRISCFSLAISNRRQHRTIKQDIFGIVLHATIIYSTDMIVYALKKLSRWSLAAIRGRSGTLKRTILFALLLSLHSSATVTATTESCTSTSCRRYLEEKKHVDTDTDTEGSVLDSNGHPVEESEEYNDHDEDDMTPEEWADYQKMHPRSSGMNVTIDDSHSSGESPSPDPGSLQNVNPEFGKQGSSMVSIGDRSPDQQGLSPPSSQQSPSPSPGQSPSPSPGQSPSPSPGQSPSPSPGQSPSPSPGQSPSPTPGANARPPPPVPFPPPAPGGPNPPSPPPSNPLNLFNPSPPPPPPFDLKSLYWREKSYIKQPCDKLDPPRDLKEWGRWSDPAMWPSGSFSGKDLDVNIP
eukprot:jgi/Botrbrau1/1873/Bobra.146_1s0060.1